MTLGLRRLLLVGGALGGIAALGQEPFGWPILMFAAIVGVLWVSNQLPTARGMFALGWIFGTGYFAVALHWIVSPFLVDIARHGWMAPFALILMSGGLALFWGAAFWLGRVLSRGTWAVVLFWAAAELSRAYVFTGFPWAMPSQALVDSLAGQALAWIGPYALNLAVFAAATLVLLRNRLAAGAVAVISCLVLLVGPQAGPAAQTGHVVRLIQPNAAQHLKWDPDQIPFFYSEQLRLTAAPPTEGMAAPSAVIWSESAIAWPLDVAGDLLAEIQAFAGDKTVVLGAVRQEGTRYFNAMAVLDPQGQVAQTFDKMHLVPFGEYVPLGNLMARFGIRGLAAQNGYGHTNGQGPRLIDLGPLGKAIPLVCYEAVFPHDVNAAPERAALMVHVSNDAWFGPAAGPRQHLAQARMRAIEQGLPMARAANTGISAMIDPYGRVTHALALNTRGYLDAPLPGPLPPTVYSLGGDLPFALFVGLLGIAVLGRRIAAPKGHTI